ncbi:hypothetical protein [Fibrobacter sp.]|uniref:hypothetical protein n=1 Tax=Fibrobacter sp. TaxID=35828 RepID=UPI0025C4A175|nr:hypothetical protein [Fibrobacter sp.]MBR3072243.1 hypothetical protein [Fibrobacter sp.]
MAINAENGDKSGEKMMSDVFIIGAGCSVPYGFPTGAMLMQKLKDFNYGDNNVDSPSFRPPSYLFDLYYELFGKYQEYANLRKAGGQYSYVADSIEAKISNKIHETIILFAQSIRHSMMVSTDEFLKNRLNQEKAEEADFGKRLIAREILVAERESEKQFAYEDGKRISKKIWLGNIDWIQHLLSLIDQQDNWEEILKQTVFLTFNYDRVLEYCIFLYLTSDKQYADADAHAFIKEMQIHHVNGFIGSLEEIPFGAVENGKYQEIAKRMETVWEKRQNRDESEKEKYQRFLKNAQRVYFMGFSYIPDNLESIGIPRGAEIIRKAKVYATAMGLSSQNRLRISTYLDLKDFEKRNEPEPMPEIEVQRTGLMSDAMYQREYEKQERIANSLAKISRIHFENRILKDASAVDLILDYYTLA